MRLELYGLGRSLAATDPPPWWIEVPPEASVLEVCGLMAWFACVCELDVGAIRLIPRHDATPAPSARDLAAFYEHQGVPGQLARAKLKR